MSAQTNYTYFPQHGAPGGIVDVSPLAINSRSVENDTGVVFPGMGVVTGTTAGVQVKLPASGATAATFEGVVVNGRTTERDLAGDLYVRHNAAVGVARWGRIYVRVPSGVTTAYGDALYLIPTGNDAGCFTNSSTNNVAIKGKFIGTVDGNAAPVELFNTPQA